MRTPHMLAVATLTLGAVTMGTRAEGATEDPSDAVVIFTDLRQDAPGKAASAQLFESLQALRRAEDGFYARSGHYTVGAADLPGYRAPAGANVFVTAGPDWLVIRGEIRSVTVQQLTIWRRGTPGVVSGSFPTRR